MEMESITLIPSDNGRFELTVNDSLLYSKLATGRHIDTSEGINLVRDYLRGGAS
jgi:predicted Rdx family selenoprotein